MLKLQGENIFLRALEPEDLDFLYELENNGDVWEISGTTAPYSKFILRQYLENAHKDIFEAKQLRLCICKHDHKVIGLIDLFDFDPKHRRAGLGLIVLEKAERNKGVGGEAIELVCNYAFSVLDLRQLFANVLEDNLPSVHLFGKKGFQKIGVKKDWIYSQGRFKNEILFQKLNN